MQGLLGQNLHLWCKEKKKKEAGRGSCHGASHSVTLTSLLSNYTEQTRAFSIIGLIINSKNFGI